MLTFLLAYLDGHLVVNWIETGKLAAIVLSTVTEVSTAEDFSQNFGDVAMPDDKVAVWLTEAVNDSADRIRTALATVKTATCKSFQVFFAFLLIFYLLNPLGCWLICTCLLIARLLVSCVMQL